MFDDNPFIITEFEEHLKRKGKKPSTVNVQISVIKNFLKTGHDIENYEHYNKFLEEHTIKKRSTYYFDVMIQFVKWKFQDKKDVRKHLLDAIYMTKKHPRDPIKKTLILEDYQLMDIIRSLENPKHALIAWIQKETGVRAGDVIRLKRDDIKFGYYKDSEKKVSLTIDMFFRKKGDKVSKIPIFDPYLIEYIKDRLGVIPGEESFVFIDRSVVNKCNEYDDFKLERRNYYLYYLDLRETCKKLGFEPSQFTTHDWRRNFANKVWIDVLEKKDIIGLQRALGHSHIDSTTRYLRYSGLESQDIFKKRYDLSDKDSWEYSKR